MATATAITTIFARLRQRVLMLLSLWLINNSRYLKKSKKSWKLFVSLKCLLKLTNCYVHRVKYDFVHEFECVCIFLECWGLIFFVFVNSTVMRWLNINYHFISNHPIMNLIDFAFEMVFNLHIYIIYICYWFFRLSWIRWPSHNHSEAATNSILLVIHNCISIHYLNVEWRLRSPSITYC